MLTHPVIASLDHPLSAKAERGFFMILLIADSIQRTGLIVFTDNRYMMGCRSKMDRHESFLMSI